MDSNEIIKIEIEAILEDIRQLYNNSGKRTSGRFEEALEARYGNNSASIYGVTYLAGRKAGKMPPVENIKEWVINKGIKPLKDEMTVSSLAWAISKSIAKKGTNEVNHLKIYEEVITPQRINDIITKVGQFNVNLFINEVVVSLELLQKNI